MHHAVFEMPRVPQHLAGRTESTVDVMNVAYEGLSLCEGRFWYNMTGAFVILVVCLLCSCFLEKAQRCGLFELPDGSIEFPRQHTVLAAKSLKSYKTLYWAAGIPGFRARKAHGQYRSLEVLASTVP